MNKKIWAPISTGWRSLVGVLLGSLLAGGLLWLHLTELLPGLSSSESIWYQQLQNGVGYKDILHNPLYLPYQAVIYFLHSLHLVNPLILRSIGAGFGLIIVGCFYLLVKQLHTTRIAALTTLLFVSSNWWLRTARMGTPEILLTWPVLLLLVGYFWHIKAHRLTLFTLLVLGGLALYLPGMVWLVLAATLWHGRRLWHNLRQQKWWFIIMCTLSVLILTAPLAWSLIHTPAFYHEYIGLPRELPSTQTYLLNLLKVPLAIFVYRDFNPLSGIGHLPLLDIFTMTMVGLGAYTYYFRKGLDRTRLLIGIFIGLPMVVALGGTVTLTILLPFIFIVAASGLGLLLQQWFTVFPRNPVARLLGISLLSFVVLLAMLYNLQNYFVAWPNTPETKQTFSHQIK